MNLTTILSTVNFTNIHAFHHSDQVTPQAIPWNPTSLPYHSPKTSSLINVLRKHLPLPLRQVLHLHLSINPTPRVLPARPTTSMPLLPQTFHLNLISTTAPEDAQHSFAEHQHFHKKALGTYPSLPLQQKLQLRFRPTPAPKGLTQTAGFGTTELVLPAVRRIFLLRLVSEAAPGDTQD